MPDKSLLSAFFAAHSEGEMHVSEERSSLITFYVLENWKVLAVAVILQFLFFLMLSLQMMLKISKASALLSLLVFFRN